MCLLRQNVPHKVEYFDMIRTHKEFEILVLCKLLWNFVTLGSQNVL
jgi:hypothetical protein